MTSIQAQALDPTISAADEWAHAASDMVALVGVWTLWVMVVVVAVSAVALLVAPLVRETRRSSVEVRNAVPPPPPSREPAPPLQRSRLQFS